VRFVDKGGNMILKKRTGGNLIILGMGLAVLVLLFSCATEREKEGDMVPAPDQALIKKAYQPLPLGQIQPRGWLYDQLRLQADGLSGHLDEFWPDIMDSAWFGGKGDSWERGPYWLDGVVPLAFLLDDAGLKQKVATYVRSIMDQQENNGMFRSVTGRAPYDLWAVFLVLKPLIQYYEATGDPEIPIVVEKCLHWMDDHIDRYPLFNWGQFRWFESLLSIYWLYEKKPETWLLDLAVKLQAQGFDWEDFFLRWPLKDPTQKGMWTFMGHVVNNAMAVKAPALWWRLTGDKKNQRMAWDMMEKLDEYHGQVTGMFTGDECFAGKDPSQGTELCAVVEYMFSLEVLMSVLGEARFGDRLERVAFNALPATFSPDMWAHQYDQQVNQAECSIHADRNWTTNGAESNLYGLEPNFGCCTANFSQGWPKFASHLWMRTKSDGLAAVAYAPCEVETMVKDVPVRVEVVTEYPFREKILIKVQAGEPVRFPILVRIPAWAKKASIQINGGNDIHPESGTFHKLDREWSGLTEIKLELPMEALASRRYRNAIAVERGPLVYSLKLGEKWNRVNADKPFRELPHADWEVYPTGAWNYALDLNEETVKVLEFVEHPVGKMPFSPDGAPISVKVRGVQIEEWRLVNGSAGEMPISPVKASGKKIDLVLIPYGCTNIRITEFPTLKQP